MRYTVVFFFTGQTLRYFFSDSEAQRRLAEQRATYQYVQEFLAKREEVGMLCQSLSSPMADVQLVRVAGQESLM